MTTARALRRTEGLYDNLLALLADSDAAARPAEPAWLSEQRRAARALLERAGLPENTDEAWRLTPLRRITGQSYVAAPATARASFADDWAASLGPERARVTIVNGTPQVGGAPAGVELVCLRDVLARPPEWIAAHLGRLSGAAGGFVAANTALFHDALCIRVPRGVQVKEPLVVVLASLRGETAQLSHPRILIVAEPGSELTVLECHVHEADSNQLTNTVCEVVLSENASLEHLLTEHGVATSSGLNQLYVRQAASSRYTSRAVTRGGAVSRLDLTLRFDGPGAEALLDGLYWATGEEHVEQHLRVEHCASHCTSNQKYKGVLDGRSRGVFDGAIQVARGTVATVAHQQNRNVLLSDEALVHTKPHLEIDADDVVCSHGATVGRLDREQLFYLRSRGISEDQAYAILTCAFAKEMTDRITHEPLREKVLRTVLAQREEAIALEELI